MRWPDETQRETAWRSVAYSVYIQRAMETIKERPNPNDFKIAQIAFQELIETIKPARIVVTGLTAYNNLPKPDKERLEPALSLERTLKAFRLSSGKLAWCLGVPHPQSRKPRYRWEEIGERVECFRRAELPLR